MKIQIEKIDDKIYVYSPYNEYLPYRAKKNGGRWNPELKCWIYAASAEPEVKEMYTEIYGYYTDEKIDCVNLLCVAGSEASITRAGLDLAGIVIAQAVGRDSGAKTSANVLLKTGNFYSGGSNQYWETIARDGTTFKVLDVPRIIAEKLVKNPEWCTSITIEEAVEDKKAALLAEKEKLQKRLIEIDDQLSSQ